MNQILHSYFPKVNATKLYLLQIYLKVSRAFLLVLRKKKKKLKYKKNISTGSLLHCWAQQFHFQGPEISPHQYYVISFSNLCLALSLKQLFNNIHVNCFQNKLKRAQASITMPSFLKHLFLSDFWLYSASTNRQNYILDGLHAACKSTYADGHLCTTSHSFIKQILNCTLYSTWNILLQMKAPSSSIK